jgi:hypothetical protein
MSRNERLRHRSGLGRQLRDHRSRWIHALKGRKIPEAGSDAADQDRCSVSYQVTDAAAREDSSETA